MFRGFARLFSCEFKLFVREPIAAFFTFVFPVFMLFLTMEVFIPAPTIAGPAGVRTINRVLPNLMVMIITTSTLMSLPLTAVQYRQIRFFKRLRANPVSSVCIAAGLGSVYVVVTSLGAALLLIIAVPVYGAAYQGTLLGILAAYTLGFLALAAICFGTIGSMLRTTRTAGAVAQIVLFPAMFFSGLSVPLDRLPEWLRPVSNLIPVTHAARLLQGTWQGKPPDSFTTEILFLLGVLVVGTALSARKFRWE